MRTAPLLLALASATPALSTVARAGEFPANHLFVCGEGSDLVLDYDEAGQLVGQLGAGSGLHAPTGLAFGADGLLYVVSSGSARVLAFDAGGSLVRTIGAGSPLAAPRGLALGPDGSLFVGNGNGTIEHFSAAGTDLGTLGTEAGLTAPADLCFGADGHLFVACASSARVIELDAAGARLRELGAGAGLAEASALALGPDGRLAIADASSGKLLLLDASGATTATLDTTALGGAAGLGFGSDGLLYVMARGGSGVVAVDAAGTVQRTLAASSDLDLGGALAFAPRRFAVTVKGTLRRPEGPALAVNETGTLSLLPGAATALLQLADGAASDDLASIFGGGTLALRGFAAAQEGGKTWQLAASAGADGVASVAAQLSGATGAQGLWLASGAKGDFWRAGEGGSFRGTLKTGAPLQ